MIESLDEWLALPSAFALIIYVSLIAATWCFARYRETYFGRETTEDERQKIFRASELIEKSSDHQRHFKKFGISKTRVFSFQQLAAWGYAPHFAPRHLFLNEQLVQFPDAVFAASTLVHEIEHSFWLPLIKATRWGERAAYQTQSDFLRASQVKGSVAELLAAYPDADQSFLMDLRESFAKYEIDHPAIT